VPGLRGRVGQKQFDGCDLAQTCPGHLEDTDFIGRTKNGSYSTQDGKWWILRPSRRAPLGPCDRPPRARRSGHHWGRGPQDDRAPDRLASESKLCAMPRHCVTVPGAIRPHLSHGPGLIDETGCGVFCPKGWPMMSSNRVSAASRPGHRAGPAARRAAYLATASHEM